MHYFVTGGTGFIGSMLISRLLEAGHSVAALIRPKSRHKARIDHPQLHWVEGDIRDPDTLKPALKDCDRVFHMAAKASVWAPTEQDFWDINVEGTCNVLESAETNNVNRFVFTSTGATLPPSDPGSPADENKEKQEFLTPYEHSKFAAEQRVRSYNRTRNIDTVIVNPTRVFGPGPLTESNAVTRIFKMYIEGKWHLLPGDGTAVGNYCFVDDVIDGHLLAMQQGVPGEQYVLGGVNLSFRELFTLLADISQKERFLIPLPEVLMKFIGRFEESRAEIFNTPPLITHAWVYKYLQNSAVSTRKAEKELGYTITPLRDAIQRTILWLQHEFSR